MRIATLPDSRSSNRWPTTSARQPRASAGGGRSAARLDRCDRPIHSRMSLGVPTRFGAKLGLAADAAQRGEEELAQDGKLRPWSRGVPLRAFVLGQVQCPLIAAAMSSSRR